MHIHPILSWQAINGAKFGVIGVVVYTDPGDINDKKASAEETYPYSWYLPPSGVERGSYSNHFGDLLTPYYPAKGKGTEIAQGLGCGNEHQKQCYLLYQHPLPVPKVSHGWCPMTSIRGSLLRLEEVFEFC